MYPRLFLKPGRDRSVRTGHCWIFSGGVDRVEAGVKDGDLVSVCSSDERFLAQGYFCKDASIAVKLLSLSDENISANFWRERIRLAQFGRERIGFLNDPKNTAYRLLNAEGDSVPGLVIDVYGETAVVQCQTLGIHRHRNSIREAVGAQLGSSIKQVFLKRGDFDGDQKDDGEEPGRGEIRENGHAFNVDWRYGQKTGFFLDQRFNRKLFGEHAAGKNVLNAFCYTGGFSIYALCGGAKRVVSIDSSKSALAILEENVALNPVSGSHESICVDFLKYMQALPRDFDMILLDPPAFAKQRSALNAGLRGYQSINAQALRAVKSGGMLFTFSCSQAVSREIFQKMIYEAAQEAGRPVQIISQLHQSPCHPISVYHPEGDYLKGLVLLVT